MNEDREQLRLLSIFHSVAGRLPGLCSFFPVFHLPPGLMRVLQPESFWRQLLNPPPRA